MYINELIFQIYLNDNPATGSQLTPFQAGSVPTLCATSRTTERSTPCAATST